MKSTSRARNPVAKRTRPPKAARLPAPLAFAQPVQLHVISDSTGNLARHMLTAFLTQFPADSFRVHEHNFIDSSEKLAGALGTISSGVIFHAVVDPAVKEKIGDFCRRGKLPCCDLTGRFVEFIAKASGIAPKPNLEKLHEVSEQYKRRIKAMEFTLEHDDGLGLETLHEADVVLVGVSRTSKTPTSIFLGQMGYKTANVALAREVAPPAELLRLPPAKVVGLLIDPLRLAELRTSRQNAWQMAGTSYSAIAHIDEELEWSRKLFRKQRWATLEVTRTAIEETAAKIVELLRLPRP